MFFLNLSLNFNELIFLNFLLSLWLLNLYIELKCKYEILNNIVVMFK